MRSRGDGVPPEPGDRSFRCSRTGESYLVIGGAGTAKPGQNEVVPESTEELMRTTWNGSLTFGLVSIPVGLAPATKPAARQSDVSFRLLHRECLTPIKQKRWCPKHDREVGARRDRQGLGGVEGPVRDRRGGRARGARGARRLAVDRDLAVRPGRGGRLRSGAIAPTSSSPARRPRSAGPTGCCSRRCARPARARSAASSARAASRSASCARGETRSCSRRCTSPRTSTPTPRSPRRWRPPR